MPGLDIGVVRVDETQHVGIGHPVGVGVVLEDELFEVAGHEGVEAVVVAYSDPSVVLSPAARLPSHRRGGDPVRFRQGRIPLRASERPNQLGQSALGHGVGVKFGGRRWEVDGRPLKLRGRPRGA